MSNLENIINKAWENKDQISKSSDKSIIDAIKETIHLLNEGKIAVAEPQGNDWKINDWIQKGILLSFRINKKKLLVVLITLGMTLSTCLVRLQDGLKRNLKTLDSEWFLIV